MSRNNRKNPAAAVAASTTHTSERGGRRGVKNHAYEASESTPSSCPKCGSTDRVPYYRKHEHEVKVDPKGKPCTHVVMRYTQCTGCGQHRIDRAFENRTGKRKSEAAA